MHCTKEMEKVEDKSYYVIVVANNVREALVCVIVHKNNGYVNDRDSDVWFKSIVVSPASIV